MNDSLRTVRVPLQERGYDIEIGTSNLGSAGAFVAARARFNKAVVVTDRNVLSPHAEIVQQSLRATGAVVELLTIEPGESSKSIEVATGLWQKLLDLGADRKTVVVAIGGGVVGDLAGFIAATFARGLPLIQIPTTLLAQVDSSVGGKTGVNLPGAKNMVGSFWQPLGVLIDTGVLTTLPPREYRAGLAEVVKYGVILDAEFFTYLEQNSGRLNSRNDEILRQVVARCCELKADVVANDEREETGLRAVLNYGHTFAHAIEAVAGYGEFLHGEAVSMGMMYAARLAEGLNRVDSSFTSRQEDLLRALELPIWLREVNADALLSAMAHDKKVAHGKLRFVLPTQLGHVELVGDVPAELVRKTLSLSA